MRIARVVMIIIIKYVTPDNTSNRQHNIHGTNRCLVWMFNLLTIVKVYKSDLNALTSEAASNLR